jgi:hypothetical protein
MALTPLDQGEQRKPLIRGSVVSDEKLDVVLWLFRGEKLEEPQPELGVRAHRMAAWWDEFLDAGKQDLKGKAASTEDDNRFRDAERKIGELALENEIWKKVAPKKRGGSPRRSPAERSGRAERLWRKDAIGTTRR